jgi:hypothetical protein
MKIVLTMIMLAIGACAALGQDDFEVSFEKNKTRFKVEKFSEGEDASSGYDYFFYKDKGKIIKVRVVWSSSANPVHRIEDYHFANGVLIGFAEYTFDGKYYRAAAKGRYVPSKLVERLTFTDGKLTAWTENGKSVPATDKRWQEKESETIASGKSQLENYNGLKENN